MAKTKTKAKVPTKAQAKAFIAKGKKVVEGQRREGTKQAKVIAMLQAAKGATYGEIAKAMEWLPHTTRAMISIAIERKLGLKVERAQEGERGLVLRIKAAT